MPTPRPNSFSSFDFSEQEILQGSVLPPLNFQMIQNDLSMAAQELMNFDMDLNDKNTVVQHAYLKAQVNIFQMLLDRHNEATKVLMAMAHQEQFANLQNP